MYVVIDCNLCVCLAIQPTQYIYQCKCLVLEDSLIDQLSIEMLLNQYPQIEAFYASTSQEFEVAMPLKQFNFIITDIQLQGKISGLDLIKPLNDASVWVIICIAYSYKSSEKYSKDRF